jgi:hypothetical protein
MRYVSQVISCDSWVWTLFYVFFHLMGRQCLSFGCPVKTNSLFPVKKFNQSIRIHHNLTVKNKKYMKRNYISYPSQFRPRFFSLYWTRMQNFQVNFHFFPIKECNLFSIRLSIYFYILYWMLDYWVKQKMLVKYVYVQYSENRIYYLK